MLYIALFFALEQTHYAKTALDKCAKTGLLQCIRCKNKSLWVSFLVSLKKKKKKKKIPTKKREEKEREREKEEPKQTELTCVTDFVRPAERLTKT